MKCEVRHKRAKEKVAAGCYDVHVSFGWCIFLTDVFYFYFIILFQAIVNVQAIWAMAYGEVFEHQFGDVIAKALSTGMHGAFVEGCKYGVASGLTYIAEALLFCIGAVLSARGMYTHLQMVEVLTLVVHYLLPH